MTQEAFGEAVAVMIKWIVLIALPELAERSHYIIDLIFIIIGNSNWQPLLKGQSSTVARLHDYDARAVIVMPTVREFMFEKFNWSVIESEAQKL